jgi:hypothetical protein
MRKNIKKTNHKWYESDHFLNFLTKTDNRTISVISEKNDPIYLIINRISVLSLRFLKTL